MSAVLYRGACMCGGVTFTMSAPPLTVGNCFCADCQMNSGGPNQTNALFAISDMTINDPEGLDTGFVIPQTHSGQPKVKHFCKRCGCMLWSETHLRGYPTYGVRVSLVEGGYEKLQPTVERYVGRRPPYVASVAGALQLEGS